MTRSATTERVIPGLYALSVGDAEMPTPPGWTWVTLTDIARLESGHTPSRSRPEYWDGDIAWIGIRDAREHHAQTINHTLQTVTQAGIDNSAARVLPAGTVCLSRTASVGYVTVMGRPMATSQDFVNWVCSDALVPEFLMYLIIAEGENIRSFGEGSTHTTIYFPQVQAFRVCIPSVAEQRRIVAKLDDLRARSYQSKEALDAIPPLLEKLRQSVLAAAFRGDLTADWRDKHPKVEPADKLLARIRVERRKKWEEAELAKLTAKGKAPKDDRWKEKYEEPAPVDASELPELPEGWCWAGLSEVSELQLGQRRAPEYANDTEYPYIRAANITWRGLDLTDVKRMGVADPEPLFLKPGDVVLNEASGSPSEVGKPALWQGEIDRCCFQATVVRVRSLWQPVGGAWMHLAFLNDALAGRFAALAPGVGMVHLTAERMRNWPVPLAPLEEQSRLISIVRRALEHWDRLDDQQQALRRSLPRSEAAILAKAFRGELVPQDPNDEPADAMLARLRAAPPPELPARARKRKPTA